MIKKPDEKNSKLIEETLKRLYATQKKSPEVGFWLLLFTYFAANIIVSMVAGSEYNFRLLGEEFPAYSFAGVFSSLANICVILIAMFYEKRGFWTAVVVLLVQSPIVLAGIIFRHNTTSLPGIFGNLLALIAVIVIYFGNRRIGKYQEKLRTVAVTDILTRIPNGFACNEIVNALVRKNEPFACVAIDINGFKTINDTMGFDAGNRVLIEVASRIKNIADNKLSGTKDFIGRTSGDEFSLIIRNFKTEEDVRKTIAVYDAAINEQFTVNDCDFFVSASFGYALFPTDADSVNDIVSYANMAMNEAKRLNSSNHVVNYSKELHSSAEILETEGLIRAAIDNDTIFYMLQPQFDMSHKLRGFEALARMKDQEGQFVSPGVFIPVAEEVGLIDKVDGIVFKKASMFIGDLIKNTGAKITLSINVSVRHLMKNDFIDEIKTLLSESGIPTEQLEIEITESVMMESLDKAMDRIREIHDMGIQIAIDDFGTGYSSLSYMSELPASLLKIDKSFIDKMNTSDKSKQYVAGIISLGHIMGFDVISEGVEEPDQVKGLTDMNCDYIQGYVWGRPLNPDAAKELILDSLK